MNQLAIFIFGGLAVFLLARSDKWQKWGYLSGLISEPFWIYAAWQADQWAVILLALWWAVWYAVGFYRRLGDKA